MLDITIVLGQERREGCCQMEKRKGFQMDGKAFAKHQKMAEASFRILISNTRYGPWHRVGIIEGMNE